jgi:4-hydroxy-tetrahydrodipicolinate reductase
VALVIGTTGFTPREKAGLLAAIKSLPVVKMTTFSVGANIFRKQGWEASKKLGDYILRLLRRITATRKTPRVAQ